MSIKLYRCENPACPLGAVGHPGSFTGGITADFLQLLTGKPLEEIEEKGLAGEGVCPNCATRGTETGKVSPTRRSDPLQPLHDQIAARVADENDPLTAGDAQDALLELVAVTNDPHREVN